MNSISDLGFDAQAYIAAVRAAGHEIELCGDVFSISGPQGFNDKFLRICRTFQASMDADPDWRDKLRAALRAELLRSTHPDETTRNAINAAFATWAGESDADGHLGRSA